jgi:hypothetical protein
MKAAMRDAMNISHGLDPRQVGESTVAKAKPKYSAAAFRGLLAKVAVAKAEARPAIEEQIKEVVELASPGFGDRFIDLFRKQWSSREDANEYVYRRNLILEWLAGFAAVERKRYAEKARQDKTDSKALRNRQMVEEFLRRRGSDSDTALKAKIGEKHNLKQSAAIEAIDRELEKRGLKSAKPPKA